MTTRFVLNIILNHVGMSLIICFNKKMKYEMDRSNHTNWLNEGPWYNKAIFQVCMEVCLEIL